VAEWLKAATLKRLSCGSFASKVQILSLSATFESSITMPGIAGIICAGPNPGAAPLAAQMLATMKHEDFYEAAAHFDPEMSVDAGLVTFREGPGGIFSSPDGTVTIILSGECLVGHEVATGETLFRLYRDEGHDFLLKLNGLFCGLLIDRERKKTLLFNDRYGMCRVYFHDRDGMFYFASEAKALLRILPNLREFDTQGVADYLTFGCTLEWRTLFRGIHIMPGGSVWAFEAGRCRKEKYFSPDAWESQSQLPPDEFEDCFQQTFKRILPPYFESSSKIGIALTGGLDSRMIMACRPQNNGHTTCYTFSGNNGRTLDDTIAARVATVSNLDHCLLRLEPDFFAGFAAHADKTVFATDGSTGISNAHETYLNRKARELAPIRLTGSCGSEILRGHSGFKPVFLSPQLLSGDWRPQVEARTKSLSFEKTNPVTFAAFKEIPWGVLYGNLAAGGSQLPFRSPYLDNELVALAFRTPDEFRRSSLPSCHLVRSTNYSLSEIPTDRGFGGSNSGLRFVTRRAFAEVTFKLDYYAVAGLPGPFSPFNAIFKPVVETLKIAGMHKFLRYSAWFRKELAQYVRDVLGSQSVRTSGIWNPEFIAQLTAAHMSGRRDYWNEINAVMTFEAVDRLLLRGLGRN
jgi:asparagine synthase (glutamine-hydrolysing)